MATWPATAHDLIQLQQALGEITPERWQPPTIMRRIGACFVCFKRVQGAGAAGDAGFAGAAVTYRRRLLVGPICRPCSPCGKVRCLSRPCVPCRSLPRCFGGLDLRRPLSSQVTHRADLALGARGRHSDAAIELSQAPQLGAQ
jgi:hypothetical protein